MKFKRHLKDAWTNLTRAKLRSLLAILGVLIGTAAVVALVTCGEAAKAKALSQIQKLGPHLLVTNLNDMSRSSSDQGLPPDQIETIKHTVRGVSDVAPYTHTYQKTRFDNQRLDGKIWGITPSLKKILDLNVKQGRFLSFLDQGHFHCLIGADVKKKLKKNGVMNPIGHQINVGNFLFTVVGVLEQDDNPRFDLNGSVLVPMQTAFQISGQQGVVDFVAQLRPDVEAQSVQDNIKSFIQQRLPDTHIHFMSPEQIMNAVKKQHQTLTVLLALIGTISLIVGGIGVMNIMLVSVTERRQEIGIRTALGATTWDILAMFLIEAVMLTAFGGILGLILGTATASVIAMMFDWGVYFFWQPLVISFSISVMIGVFFGYYPAHKAARLDPIEAMRQ